MSHNSSKLYGCMNKSKYEGGTMVGQLYEEQTY